MEEEGAWERRRPSLFCLEREGLGTALGCSGGDGAARCPPLSHSKAVTSFPGSASVQGVSGVTDDVTAGRERRLSVVRQCTALAGHSSGGSAAWGQEGGRVGGLSQLHHSHVKRARTSS